MLTDVVAWESHMRGIAGSAAADPRHPDIQAKFETWRGNIETMSEIELGIDPGSTACDEFIATISGKISDGLKKILPTAVAAASSAAKPVRHCETLPGIFSRMIKQVTTNMPLVLEQQCKLPWLSDDYFAVLRERRATAGASSPARPASALAKAGTPTLDQQASATARCRSLFEPPQGAIHGDLVDSLVVDLDAIIYREGRQAPSSAK
jgi:hypothetical protein